MMRDHDEKEAREGNVGNREVQNSSVHHLVGDDSQVLIVHKQN